MFARGGLAVNSTQIGLDMILCMLAFVFWLLFFAQFTLPLKRVNDRLEAFYRLFLYILGLAGPAIRIENGEILERKGEIQRTGPGVAILDTASAALVRNPAQFIHSIGPGLWFTDHSQSIAGTVDLHLQRAGIGPQENDDPFAQQDPEESPAAFQARQDRRFATQGLTRDGIEVVPRISVSVRLDANQTTGRTHFGFNPEATERAVKGMPVDLSASAKSTTKVVDLTWLPLRLAADIWKESISHYTLEDLFSYEPGKVTALQTISEQMKVRLTRPQYPDFDSFGRPTGAKIRSKEFEMLKSRGIKVISSSVTFLKFPKSIEEQLVQLWRSTWMARAMRERENVEQQRSYETERGRRSAMGLYARGVSHYLGAQNVSLRLEGEQILLQLIRGSLYLVNQESYLHRLATDEIEQLKELLEWSEQRPER